MTNLRTSGFRLGQCRGRIRPKNDKTEAQLQRDVFLLGSAAFECGQQLQLHVRWAAYEVPLFKASRGKAIDLMGYDSKFNIYLIELKRGNSGEKLEKVVEQINEYGKVFEKIQNKVQEEFNRTFFCNAQFQEIRKVILAPRRYFSKKPEVVPGITLAYFARLRQEHESDLLKRKSPLSISLLHRQKVAESWKMAAK